MNTLSDKIKKYTDTLFPTVFDEVDSTNRVARKLATDGAPEGTAVIAARQTAGRGRLGRTFFSPEGGIYMSVVLRPQISAADTLFITVAAASAAAEALKELGGRETAIKWVNDIYIHGKKVCGILTEGGMSRADALDFAVLGIGINLSDPKSGFPDDLPLAGSVFGKAQVSEETKAQIIARFANKFFEYYKNLGKKEFISVYKKKSFLTGKTVTFERDGALHTACVLGIDDNAALLVDCNGKTLALSSGDVQIKEFN